MRIVSKQNNSRESRLSDSVQYSVFYEISRNRLNSTAHCWTVRLECRHMLNARLVDILIHFFEVKQVAVCVLHHFALVVKGEYLANVRVQV